VFVRCEPRVGGSGPSVARSVRARSSGAPRRAPYHPVAVVFYVASNRLGRPGASPPRLSFLCTLPFLPSSDRLPPVPLYPVSRRATRTSCSRPRDLRPSRMTGNTFAATIRQRRRRAAWPTRIETAARFHLDGRRPAARTTPSRVSTLLYGGWRSSARGGAGVVAATQLGRALR